MTVPVAQPVAKNRPKTADNRARTTKTLRAVLTEALQPRVTRKKRKAVLSWVQEMDQPMSPDEPMDSTPAASGEDLDEAPPAHGKELMQAIIDLIDSSLEGIDGTTLDQDYKDKLDAIKDIASSHEGVGGNDDDEDDDDDDDDDGTATAATEAHRRKLGKGNKGGKALREENQRLKRECHVRQLCDAAKFTPTATQLKALAPAHLGDVEIKALIENFKGPMQPTAGSATPANKPAQKPFSQSPGAQADAHPGQQPVQSQTLTESDEQARQRKVRRLRAGLY